MIPYFRLRSNEKELEELTKIHQSASWANGEHIKKVEEELKTLFKRQHVVLTSNGNSALFIALRSLGIKGKEVIVPSISTCFAITNAVVTTGNTPVFCDVNETDGNCSLDDVTKLVKQRGIKYIISANFAGNLSAVSEFKKLGLTVIEDACQSFFSNMGSISEADVQVFSFYPTKGVNGIDGGALLLNDLDTAKSASKLVYYDDQLEYETSERYNFRFLNTHAAVLLANLKQIKQTQERLTQIGDKYMKALRGKKGVSILQNAKSRFFQRLVISVDETFKFALQQTFKDKEIALSPFFIWNNNIDERRELLNASKLVNSTFCLPYFEDLTDNELSIVIEALDHVFTESH